MADLLDIVPSTAVDVVKIDGQRYTVRGISLPALASIVARFPKLRSLGGNDGDIIMHLIVGVSAAVGPIIAAGCGHLGEEKYEQHAAKLLPDQQMQFIKAIWGLTFPNGLGFFVETLTSIMGASNEEAKVFKVRLKQSPSTLPPSSDEDSRPTMQ